MNGESSRHIAGPKEVSEAGVEYTPGSGARLPLFNTGILGGQSGDGEHIGEVEVSARQATMADRAYRIHSGAMEPHFRPGDVVGIRDSDSAQ